jgi:sugar lactone lactonase YvrE
MTSVSSPTANVRIIASGLEFPEGPVALADGSVLVTEIAAGTLAKVSPNDRIERIAHLGGGPNGAAIGPDGAVYVCNNGGSFSFPMITNLCFGGPDHRTAFITCSGTRHLIAVDWPRPGGRLAFSEMVTT